jgi:hypothetical protein
LKFFGVIASLLPPCVARNASIGQAPDEQPNTILLLSIQIKRLSFSISIRSQRNLTEQKETLSFSLLSCLQQQQTFQQLQYHHHKTKQTKPNQTKD